jgi:hypothetical protein
MRDSFRSAFFLLAPCLGLGAFALFLARRPKPAPSPSPYGPLAFSVQGVEAQKGLPINISEGYDRRFHLVLQGSGAHPKWWGQSINSKSGTSISGWKFWLERGAKRTPFKPTKTLIWTTDWDDSKKRYYNEFLLHCGAIPADASLKVSGTTRVSLSAGATTFKASSPFEVTLKKANEVWIRPHVSTVPRFVIRKIEIRRLKNGRTVGLVTVFAPPGADFDHGSLYTPRMLTGDWQVFNQPSYFFGLGFSSGSNFVGASPSEHVQTFTFQWITSTVGRVPQRDLIVTGRYSISNSWPLEIAFAIKKDGKSVFGVVPAITRSKGVV